MSSLPQVPGPGGWSQHDHEVRLAYETNKAAHARLTMKLIATVVLVLLFGLGWMFRWEITPIDGGESIGAAYMQNRWTGDVYYVRMEEQYALVKGK